MKRHLQLMPFFLAMTIVGAIMQVLTIQVWAASSEKVLYRFTVNSAGGSWPNGELILDAAGNLYGTTIFGGDNLGGVAFKLTRGSGGIYQTVLHAFPDEDHDGFYPNGGLILDAAGNLYGVTQYNYDGSGDAPPGTVFLLSPRTDGSWAERVLYNFSDSPDAIPVWSLTPDAGGNLYGVTIRGDEAPDIVFKLTRVAANTGGIWKASVIYDFPDIAVPDDDNFCGVGHLALDSHGNLFGTTQDSVFELSPNASGGWTETSIFIEQAQGGVIFDAKGNLYGTAWPVGDNFGSVFEVSPLPGGGWMTSTLYAFKGGADGADPIGSLVFDAEGNIYGATQAGGTLTYGTIFKLSPNSDGSWTESVVYSFRGGSDGAVPTGSLVLDRLGNLYGTTVYGGGGGCTYGCGTVFKLTP